MSSSVNTTHRGGALGGADPTDLVREAVGTAKRVYDSLSELVSEPPSRRGGVRATASGSSPSWHAQAAYLVLELRTTARELETGLRLRVTGDPGVARGGSNVNVFLALDQVVELAGLAVRAARWEAWQRLDTWNLRGRTCLGEVEPLAMLPRLPGKREPHCPYCHHRTLRQQVLAALVRCVNPACRDGDGNRPVAHVTLGSVSGEPLMTWRDGTSGLDSADEAAA